MDFGDSVASAAGDDSFFAGVTEGAVSAKDLLNASTQSIPVNVKDLEKALSDYRKENFSLKMRIVDLDQRLAASENDQSKDFTKENTELQAENNSLRSEIDNYKRLLLDAQKAIETLRSGALHANRLRSLTQTNKELEEQILTQKHELEHALTQLNSAQQEREMWREKAEATTAAAQRAALIHASQLNEQHPIEDAAFQRAKELEYERNQLALEVQSLRAESETSKKLLARYREESEGHYTALQTARERLKRMTSVFDRRIAEVRQEESDRHQQRIAQLESQLRGQGLDRGLQDRLIERNALLLICHEHLEAVLTPSRSSSSGGSEKPTASQLTEGSTFRVFETDLLGKLRILVSINDHFRQQSRRIEQTQEARLRSLYEKFQVQVASVQRLQQQLNAIQSERVRWSSATESKLVHIEQAESRAQIEIRKLRDALAKESTRVSDMALQIVSYEDQLHQQASVLSAHQNRLSSFVKKAASLVRLLVSVDRRETMEDIAEALMELLRQLSNKSRSALEPLTVDGADGQTSQSNKPSVSDHAPSISSSVAQENEYLAQEVRKLKQQLSKREFLIKKALSRLEQINEQKEGMESAIFRQVDDVYQQMRASSANELL